MQVICTVLSVDTDLPPAVYGDDRIVDIAVDIRYTGSRGRPLRWWWAWWTASTSSIRIRREREKSVLDLTVSGTKDAVMMVEAGAKEITEKEMLGAILFGTRGNQKDHRVYREASWPKLAKPKMEIR